ncbi:hypothetical protein WN982_40725 [Paraburkholderia sp. IMGN_8]|uniref:hypothetical protein n=1 Tax=Paraburkholderia sp. IMGN_8 TaxID=3136564 RepID=UPI0031017F21
MSAEFSENAEGIAAWLLRVDAASFCEEIEAERGVMSDEYARDSKTLKQQLGAPGGVRQAGNGGLAGITGAVAGEVTRTAVRITLWNLI